MIDSGLIDLRFGRWQDVLADVTECDALITDPPYSERTAKGYRNGTDSDDLSGISYGSITEGDATEIASFWARRVQRWTVIFADHIAWRWHEAAWEREGRYTFAPVIWAKIAAPPRLRGDGPASQVDHIMIARPRSLPPDGHRRGWYKADTPRHGHGQGVTGNKDPEAMRALIRDYTRRGDLVVDPYAGSGTTAIACAIEGRRCITAECDPKHYEIARKRIAAGWTPDLPGVAEA